MSPELIKAINERTAAGQTKEEIIQAILAMGYTPEVADAAYILATHDQVTGTKAPLRFSARALFFEGWQFAKKHPRFTLVSSIPLIAEVFLTAARNNEFGIIRGYPIAVALSTASVVAALIYIAFLMVILMRATNPDVPLSRTTAMAFIKQHFLSLCVIYLFSGLMILGGFTLFILPGVAVMISVTFAQYVYIHEGKRGMSALLQSAALVRGRFAHLFQKIVSFFFLALIPMLVGTIFFTIIEEIYKDPTLPVFNEALLQIVAATITVINIHAMNSVYLRLKDTDLQLPGKLFPKIRYILLTLIGVVTTTLIALAVAFEDKLDFLDDIPTIETASGVQEQVSATALLANRYFQDNNQSFTGVCESLKNSVTEGVDVQCNDVGEGWALSATDTDGTMWCADKNTPAKQIKVPLDSRTECIAI